MTEQLKSFSFQGQNSCININEATKYKLTDSIFAVAVFYYWNYIIFSCLNVKNE